MTLLFTLISFVLGLYFLRNNIIVSIIISVCYLAFIIFKFRDKRIAIFLGAFVIGIALPMIPMENNPSDYNYSGMVIETKENYFLFQSKFEKFYVYEADNKREVGDFLVISSKPYDLRITTYESQFSFKEYLSNKGVKRQLYSNHIEEKFHNPIRLKEFKNSFLDKYGEQEAFLIDAFLFCNRNYESSVISAASELNVIFLLSMSGVYLSFLLNGLRKILRLILKPKIADVIPFLLLFPYSIFTFPKIGIIRVMSLYLLRYLNRNFWKNKLSQSTMLGGIGITLLIFDYHLAYQEAFYFGYLISLIAMLLRPLLSNYKLKKRNIIIPILIYLFLLPISNLLTGSFHIFSFLFQLVLLPLNEIFISFSLVSFYIYTPFPFIIGNLTKVLTAIYGYFQKIDVIIPVGDFVIFLLPIYYFGYFYLCYLLESKRRIHILSPNILIASSVVISLLPVRMFLTNAIYFINVGQGDSILIKNKNNIVMIDTGGSKQCDLARDSLIPFLRKKQINHIDALITTHNDFDHMGASSSLMENFTVKAYLPNTAIFPYQIGDIYLENLNQYKGSEENDNSLVFNLSFMGKKWLLMGDAGINVEKFLIDNNYDIDCDVLKVGHHGSKTSTSEDFLKACSPNEAIISVGEKNSYGHPNSEILERLNKYNVNIRRTDKEGTISYVCFAS